MFHQILGFSAKGFHYTQGYEVLYKSLYLLTFNYIQSY